MNRLMDESFDMMIKELAVRKIVNLLRRPEQLEKIDGLRKNLLRNIVSLIFCIIFWQYFELNYVL